MSAPEPEPPEGGGGGGLAPLTQHCVFLCNPSAYKGHVLSSEKRAAGRLCTWIVSSPGHAPETKFPSQLDLSLVFKHKPEPWEVLHSFLTQH